MDHKLVLVLTREQIEARIQELGQQISQDYANRDLVLVCVLRGSVYFTVDLSRSLTVEHQIDFMALASDNQLGDNPFGVVKIAKDLETDITGKDVLIIEDIVDTGLSLQYLIRHIQTRHPAGLRVCTLINIPARRIVNVPLTYRGFELPNIYAVGYGLDYLQQYRQRMALYSLIKT